MGAKPNEKGGEFERVTAKQLSRWLTAGASETELIRSVMSGGWRKRSRELDDFRQVGDLAPNGARGEEFRRVFGVECKHHKVIDLWHALTSPKSEWLAWWPKLCDECRVFGLVPLLFMRQNMRCVAVGLPVTLLHPGVEPPLVLSLPDPTCTAPRLAIVRVDWFLNTPFEVWKERACNPLRHNLF